LRRAPTRSSVTTRIFVGQHDVLPEFIGNPLFQLCDQNDESEAVEVAPRGVDSLPKGNIERDYDDFKETRTMPMTATGIDPLPAEIQAIADVPRP